MGPRGRRVAAALALALVATGSVAAAHRSRHVRQWLWQATGEESMWEGAKGVVALSLLTARGDRLQLAPDAPREHAGVNPHGVNAFLQLEVEPENVRRSLALVKDAGMGWVRQQFPWEDIEIHGRGDFEDRRNEPARSAWAKYDRIVKAAADHNVQLLVRLDDPPDWAYADPAATGDKGPPDSLDDFGDFVAAVVRRYCGRLRYYQIWNEPNIYPEWGERDVNPAGYAQLLRVAATSAREACPSVVIVSAALAQTTEPGGRNMDDLRYLEALYRAGWRDDFDVLAVQAFGLWTGPTDHRVSRDRANFVRPLLARDIMVRNGDAEKAVWITEMGWDSPPTEMEAPYGRIDEDGRARYTLAAYDRIDREWPWVGVSFLWFLRRPDFDWHQRPEGYFRIVEPDWAPTPTYIALAEKARRGPSPLARGRHPADDWALRYSGPWRDEPAEGPIRHRVGVQDAELHFAFRGTGFEVLLAKTVAGAAPPSLYVVVDDEDATIEPAVSDAGYTLSASGLPNREHLVIVRVEAGEAWIGEVKVTAPDLPSPLAPFVRLALAGALLIVAGAASGFAVARHRRAA